MTWLRFIGRGLKWNSIALLVTSLTQVAITILLARVLGPEAVGVMALALVVMRIGMPLTDLGLANSLIQSNTLTHHQISTLYWTQILLGILAFLLTIFIAAPTFDMLYPDQNLQELISVGSLVFLVSTPGLLYMASIKKQLRFREVGWIQMVVSIVEFLVFLFLLFRWKSVMAVLVAYVVRWGCHTLLCWMRGRRWIKPQWVFRWKESRGLLQFGFYDFSAQLVHQFSSQIDRLIIGKVLGQAALGFYVIAWDLVHIPVARWCGIFNQATYPIYAKIQSSTHRLRDIYGKVLATSSLVVWPLMLTLMYYAGEVISLLYGVSMLPAASVLSAFCLLGMVNAVSSNGYTLLLALGHSKFGFLWNTTRTSGMLIILFVVLAITPTIEHVAWGLTGVVFLLSIGWHWFIIRTSGVERRTVTSTLLTSVVALLPIVVGMAFAGLLDDETLRPWSHWAPLIGLLVSAALIWQRRKNELTSWFALADSTR
jgi:teichuronic acid exporter